jgi:RNA polymerase sigma-70 factor (ECF subfamily)
LEAYAGPAAAEPALDERDLVERAKHDREAFGALYERYYPALVNYVFRRTGDVHATEDLVADVFLIVLRTLPGYRYRGIPLRFWLLRVATNVVNRWARRARHRVAAPLEYEQVADLAASSTRCHTDEQRIRHALLTLSPKHQAVLALYHLEGLSVKETAAVIGCREGTVRSRLTRAREVLRARLA